MNKAQLARLRMARSMLLKEGSFNQVADYSLVGDKEIFMGGNTACHAGLDRTYNRQGQEGLYGVASGLMYNRAGWNSTTDAEKRVYLHYLLNKSPYASSFVSKSAANCLKVHAVMSSGYSPSNVMAGGLVATRRMWEYTNTVSCFAALVKRGVESNLAFLLGHIVNCKESPVDKTPTDWNYPKSGHTSLNMGMMTLNACKNFINGEVKSPNTEYVKNTVYYGYSDMFSEDGPGGQVFIKYVHTNFPYQECRGGPKKVSANPFQAAIKAADGDAGMVDFSKAMDVMAKWAPTLMEAIKNA